MTKISKLIISNNQNSYKISNNQNSYKISNNQISYKISNNQISYKISNNQDFQKAIKELSELKLQRQAFNKDQKYYFYKCMVYGEIYYILSIYINLTNTTNTNIIIKKKDKFKNNFEEFFKSVEDINYKNTIIKEFILVNNNKLMEINQPTDLKLLKELVEYFIYFNKQYKNII